MNLLQKTKKKLVKVYVEVEDLGMPAETMLPHLNDTLAYLLEGYSLQMSWAEEIEDLPFSLYSLLLQFLQKCSQKQIRVVISCGQVLREALAVVDLTEFVEEWQS